jgi:hypothetical protein
MNKMQANLKLNGLKKRFSMPEYLLEGMVRVCVRCYPGETIFKRLPHLRGMGMTISHGYCQDCFEKTLAENNCQIKPQHQSQII